MLKFIKDMYEKYREVISYLFFGVLTTVVNLIVYFFCKDLCNIHYLVSNAIAWVIAVIFAYWVNKVYVFESKANTFKDLFIEFVLFIAARLASGVADMFCLFLMVDMMGISDNIAKFICQVMVVIMNYVFSKLIVFRKKD